MIMAAEKSPCLELASQRPRRTSGVSSSPRAGRLEFQFESKYKKKKKPMFQLRQPGRKISCLLVGRSAFSFYSGPQMIRWGPPTSRMANFCTRSTDSNVNHIQKHSHEHTQSHVWPNTWPPLVPVNLTHKINHRAMYNSFHNYIIPLRFLYKSVFWVATVQAGKKKKKVKPKQWEHSTGLENSLRDDRTFPLALPSK